MSDNNAGAAQAPAAANKGVKQGLPATGLPVAAAAAQKLWNVARLGTVTPEAYARQFGDKAKASGGAWDTRLATLRGFKLVRSEGKNIGLSDLGRQLVNTSNPSGQTEARRTAVMSLKAYRDLVESFDGTSLPEKSALAAKLQFEYGKTTDFSQRAAQAFIDSLKFAEMLDQDDVVRAKGVAATPPIALLSDVEEPGEPVNDPRLGEAQEMAVADEDEDAVEIDRAFAGDENSKELAESTTTFTASTANLTPTVSLAMTLDLSRFRAEEVIQILSALGVASRE
jgi:hypothetical protein